MLLATFLDENNYRSKEIYIVNHSKSLFSLYFKYMFSTDNKGIAKDKYIMIMIDKKNIIICKIDKDFNLLYTSDIINKTRRVKIDDVYISTSKNPFARLNNSFF